MTEIKIDRRIKYAGDVHKELLNAGWDLQAATLFVNNIPDADAAPVKHGRWVDRQPDVPDYSYKKANMSYFCSCCKHNAGKYKHSVYKFCPWCGAKMDQ